MTATAAAKAAVGGVAVLHPLPPHQQQHMTQHSFNPFYGRWPTVQGVFAATAVSAPLRLLLLLLFLLLFDRLSATRMAWGT